MGAAASFAISSCARGSRERACAAALGKGSRCWRAQRAHLSVRDRRLAALPEGLRSLVIVAPHRLSPSRPWAHELQPFSRRRQGVHLPANPVLGERRRCRFTIGVDWGWLRFGWSGTIAPHGPHPTKIACPTNTHMWCKTVLVCCCPLVRLPRPSTRTTRRMLCKNFQKCQHCGDGRASEPRHF